MSSACLGKNVDFIGPQQPFRGINGLAFKKIDLIQYGLMFR